ncbi:hypothetical protein GQ53DRAFT_674006 [Thozetella sp. PMI_491]|nr:hypothetical protein GQ53DRAFT_674006 [Thozetella sp. PMI_491]
MSHRRIDTSRNVLLITGAGMSTNTGIPSYQNTAGSSNASQIVYHASAYITEDSARMLHEDILAKSRARTSAPLTAFDHVVEGLVKYRVLRRQYTQNIDCRHMRLPNASRMTL